MDEQPKRAYKRKRPKGKRYPVNSSIDEVSFKTLEMLGFHIPALIEELLIKISGQRRCPTCGRDVRPMIYGSVKRE